MTFFFPPFLYFYNSYFWNCCCAAHLADIRCDQTDQIGIIGTGRNSITLELKFFFITGSSSYLRSIYFAMGTVQDRSAIFFTLETGERVRISEKNVAVKKL